MMALTVGQQGKDLLTGVGHFLTCGQRFLITQTDVALATVVVVLFTEVAKELTATALVVGLHVGQHGLDAVGIALAEGVVDIGRKHQVLSIFTSLHIADVGCALLRDEVNDMLLG